MHDPFLKSEDAAPSVGTLHYAEGAAATVPQNLGGLSRRRGQLTDKLVRGWRVLLRPEADRGLQEISAGETVMPVGTITQSGDNLGVLKFQPVLYTHANLQEYRARRRREEQLGRAVLGLLAVAVTVSVGIVLFVHPAAKRNTTLPAEQSAPVAEGLAAPARPAPAVPRTYAIARGDTLGGVAFRHKVKLRALLDANDLTEKSTLRIGRKLIIPGTTVMIEAPRKPIAPAVAARPAAEKPAAQKPVAAAPVAPATHKRDYTVRRGDYSELIAKRFGVSPETVLFHNHLTKQSVLHPGQKLEIPPADGYYHTVRRGESLAKLLKAHDLEEAKFRRFNPAVGGKLEAKQLVFIPGKPPAIAEPKKETKRYRGRDGRKQASRGFFGDLGRALSDSFNWPISSRAISSGFGERGRHDWHPGIDIRAGVGTPIRAARDGVVVRAGWEGAYGRMVEISHGGGVSTRYAHASSLSVKAGERVEAGEVIGRVGTSGRSTGPHLHYEVRVHGRPVNPRKVY